MMEADQEEVYSCKRCNENVDMHSKFASFEDEVWHENCFHCDECSLNLNNMPFSMQKNDKLVCKECYKEKYAPHCSRCEDAIVLGEETFRYGERKWHRRCFTCDHCSQQLKPVSFWRKENNIYCKECFGKLHTDLCARCNEIIWKFGITYHEDHLHPECFTCHNCAKNLVDEKFFSKESDILCLACYKEKYCDKCHKCNDFITGVDGEKMVTSENLRWHPNCFLCADCNKSLVGLNFIMRQQDIICPECKQVASSA